MCCAGGGGGERQPTSESKQAIRSLEGDKDRQKVRKKETWKTWKNGDSIKKTRL